MNFTRSPTVICLKGALYNAGKPLKIDDRRGISRHEQTTQFSSVVKTGEKEQKHINIALIVLIFKIDFVGI